MSGFSEDIVELVGIETLKSLGWVHLHGSIIAPDGPSPQRPSYSDAILLKRLEAWVARINPDVPEEVRSEAIRKVVGSETHDTVEENRRLHKLLTEGVTVEYRSGERIVGEKVWLVDFEKLENNDWLVRQSIHAD